jgi:endonuclease/exonuclease/phosphatase family metal-dependent hydrolase
VRRFTPKLPPRPRAQTTAQSTAQNTAQNTAATLRVATWNLGWHLDSALAQRWIGACSRPFQLEGERWRPAAAAAEGTRSGWELPWGRNAPVEWDIGELPPCDIYQLPGANGQRSVLPVSAARYAERSSRIAALLRERVDADVIAFQEVSGAQAVRELLGPDWRVCSYEGHKVQRLAIAWKASLGEGVCEPHWPLALPGRVLRDQLRPGLALSLKAAGKIFKVLTVHLKSSCVTPLDDQSRSPGRGQLDGEEPNCRLLQAQVGPLETWLDGHLRDSDALLMLGDFNRNLAHEAAEAADAPVRLADGRTRNLWRELNDADPKPLTLLSSRCEGGSEALCSLGHRQPLGRQDYGRLRGELGCRNPIGLDHALSAGALKNADARKVALGADGETTAERLALSDHCPVLATVGF